MNRKIILQNLVYNLASNTVLLFDFNQTWNGSYWSQITIHFIELKFNFQFNLISQNDRRL